MDARPAPAAAETEDAPLGSEAPAHRPNSGPPLRFTWRTDADGRLSAISPEFAALVGERADAMVGRARRHRRAWIWPARRDRRPDAAARDLVGTDRDVARGRQPVRHPRRSCRPAGIPPRPQLRRIPRLRCRPPCRCRTSSGEGSGGREPSGSAIGDRPGPFGAGELQPPCRAAAIATGPAAARHRRKRQDHPPVRAPHQPCGGEGPVQRGAQRLREIGDRLKSEHDAAPAAPAATSAPEPPDEPVAEIAGVSEQSGVAAPADVPDQASVAEAAAPPPAKLTRFLPSAFAGAGDAERADNLDGAAQQAADRRPRPSRSDAALRQPGVPRPVWLRVRRRTRRSRWLGAAVRRARCRRAGRTASCGSSPRTAPNGRSRHGCRRSTGRVATLFVLLTLAPDEPEVDPEIRRATACAGPGRGGARRTPPSPVPHGRDAHHHRHRHRRRRADRPRRHDPLDQPPGRGAVRLRQRRGRPASRSPRCLPSKASARRATISTACPSHGVASVLNDGREVIGREAQGRFIPLFMTIGRLPNDSGFCAVRARHHAVEARRGGSDPGARAWPSAPPRRRPISWPASATRSARRSTPSSAFPS